MTAWAWRDRFAIAGIGETEYTKASQPARAEFTLACEAVLTAVADAGLTVRDVDGFCVSSYERSNPMAVAQAIGSEGLVYAGAYPGGGNSATGMVHHAIAAIASGEAEVVVCYRSLCQNQFGRYGRALGIPPAQEQMTDWQNFGWPFGLFNAAHMYALSARRHMALYGTTSEHFGRIAVAIYDNAQRNPRAVMYGRPITLADHQASRMISDPYRLYDCCQESNGACALVVTRADRARSGPHPVVTVAGTAHRMEKLHGVVTRPPHLWDSSGLATTAGEIYRRAGVGPEDIDVAQLYEAFTGNVLMDLEDFGFCAPGDSGAFVDSGAINWPDGSLPINTSGGNLAEAYLHGLGLVLEGVRQGRGTSTSQVDRARHILVVSASGPYSGGMVLRRHD